MNFQKKYHFELALYVYKERVTGKMHFLQSAEFSTSLPCVAWSPDVIGSLLCRWLPSDSASLNKIFGFIAIKYLVFCSNFILYFPCQKLPAIVQSVQKVGCKQEEIMYIEQFVTPCSGSGKRSCSVK